MEACVQLAFNILMDIRANNLALQGTAIGKITSIHNIMRITKEWTMELGSCDELTTTSVT